MWAVVHIKSSSFYDGENTVYGTRLGIYSITVVKDKNYGVMLAQDTNGKMYHVSSADNLADIINAIKKWLKGRFYEDEVVGISINKARLPGAPVVRVEKQVIGSVDATAQYTREGRVYASFSKRGDEVYIVVEKSTIYSRFLLQLMPDPGILAEKVFDELRDEIRRRWLISSRDCILTDYTASCEPYEWADATVSEIMKPLRRWLDNIGKRLYELVSEYVWSLSPRCSNCKYFSQGFCKIHKAVKKPDELCGKYEP